MRIRLPGNNSLKRLILPHLKRPAGSPPNSGVQVKVIEFYYQAEKWNKPRRVVCNFSSTVTAWSLPANPREYWITFSDDQKCSATEFILLA